MMIKRKISGQSGVSAIEFAIVLPVLLLILFGIIEFSILLYNKAIITNASREGARHGIKQIYETDSSGNVFATYPGDATNVAEEYCNNLLITFDGSSSAVATADPADPGSAISGDTLTMTVTFDYGFLILPEFMTRQFDDFRRISAQTKMRFE